MFLAEQDLLPAHGETPCRIKETGRVCGKGTGDGEYNGQFAQGLHDAVQHGADGKVGEQDGGWAACVEGAAGGDEQTGTYGMSQVRQRLCRLDIFKTGSTLYRSSRQMLSFAGASPSTPWPGVGVPCGS